MLGRKSDRMGDRKPHRSIKVVDLSEILESEYAVLNREENENA
jgi:hypothetical protein